MLHSTGSRKRALAALGEREAAASLAWRRKQQEVSTLSMRVAYALLAGSMPLDLSRAQELLELSVEQLEQQVPNRYLVQAYRRLAEVLKAKGDTEAALGVLERALGVQERVKRPLA
jgi:HEAT repeat protein